jgi:hypothetical protein
MYRPHTSNQCNAHGVNSLETALDFNVFQVQKGNKIAKNIYVK